MPLPPDQQAVGMEPLCSRWGNAVPTPPVHSEAISFCWNWGGSRQVLPVDFWRDNMRGKVKDEVRKLSSVKYETPCFSTKPRKWTSRTLDLVSYKHCRSNVCTAKPWYSFELWSLQTTSMGNPPEVLLYVHKVWKTYIMTASLQELAKGKGREWKERRSRGKAVWVLLSWQCHWKMYQERQAYKSLGCHYQLKSHQKEVCEHTTPVSYTHSYPPLMPSTIFY